MMTRLEKAVTTLDRSVKEVFKLTKGYTLHVDSDGRLEAMVQEPDFERLPGASQTPYKFRGGELYPYYRSIRIGKLAIECLYKTKPKTSKDGE